MRAEGLRFGLRLKSRWEGETTRGEGEGSEGERRGEEGRR